IVGGKDASSTGPAGTAFSIAVGGLTWSYEPGVTPPNQDTLIYEQTVRAAASAFLLLDLAELLSQHLPSVWSAIQGGPAPASTDPGSALYTALNSQRADTHGNITWSEALSDAWQAKDTWQASDVFSDPKTAPIVPDLSCS